MPKLYLTSVIDCISRIEDLAPDFNTKLLVLPFAHNTNYLPDAESIYHRYDRDIYNTESIYYSIVRPFIDIGIDPDNIVIVNHYVDSPKLIKHKILAPNTYIYFPGGEPQLIPPILKKLGIIDALKETNNPIFGASAGSMFWSNKYFVWNDGIDYFRYQTFKGINVIKDFCIIPHYQFFNPDEKVSKACRRFKLFNRKKTIYLMLDGGYMVYNTNTGRIEDRYNTLIY